MPAPHPRLQIAIHDSPLGRWTVAVWRPAPRLDELVATMWFGEGQVSYARDRILPSAQSQLLINLGPPQYRIEPGPPERRVPFRDIWYSALHQGPIDTEAPHGSALLGVAFKATGAFPWLGQELAGLGDRIIALADALGDGVLRLRERLLECRDVAMRFELVEAWLLARLHPRCSIHPAVRWAVTRIADSGGQVDVATLARLTGYTRKHLSELFERQIGLSPKALARVHRFKDAMTLLAARTEVPWSQLAAQCGYYDQSHLVRDFRAFSGYAPGELLKRDRPDGGSVVVR
jgi:AraC-like DNA-binding protein